MCIYAKYKIANGIEEIIILSTIFAGNLNLKSGSTIITLNKKYKKFAHNVAIPTPTSPYSGINAKLRTTPTIPDTTFMMKSINRIVLRQR